MRDARRLVLVCEDLLTDRFVRRLCERYGVFVERSEVKPKSRDGAADAWVVERYPKLVALRRSKNFRANLGFLFVVDGDDFGVRARKQLLERKLRDAEMAPREADESIAVFDATRSAWPSRTGAEARCGRCLP